MAFQETSPQNTSIDSSRSSMSKVHDQMVNKLYVTWKCFLQLTHTQIMKIPHYVCHNSWLQLNLNWFNYNQKILTWKTCAVQLAICSDNSLIVIFFLHYFLPKFTYQSFYYLTMTPDWLNEVPSKQHTFNMVPFAWCFTFSKKLRHSTLTDHFKRYFMRYNHYSVNSWHHKQHTKYLYIHKWRYNSYKNMLFQSQSLQFRLET